MAAFQTGVDSMKTWARNRIGQTFGLLTVLQITGKDLRSNSKVLCQCRCGTQCERDLNNLVAGQIKSCGCLQRRRQALIRAAPKLLEGMQEIAAGNLDAETLAQFAARCHRKAKRILDEMQQDAMKAGAS
jgi:hypothetical protein